MADSTDPELLSFVSEINSKCPCRTKYDVGLDSAKVLSHMSLEMYYTTFQKNIRDRTSEQTLNAMKKADVDELKNSTRTQIYRTKKVTLQYIYFDSVGRRLYQFSISPSEYSK